MNADPENGREELSMEWLKRRLKAISAVDPPPSLRGRLEAGIPAAAGPPIIRSVWLVSRGMRWAGVAAVLVLGVCAIVWFGTPRGRPMRSTIDTNRAPGGAYATDHNSLRPADTNFCDFNSLR